MIYPNNFEQKIGFASIRQMLSDLCISQMGLEKAEEMTFSSDKTRIVKSLEQNAKPSTKFKLKAPVSTWRTYSL